MSRRHLDHRRRLDMAMRNLPQWFYLAGSLLFVVGTIISMARK